MKISKEYNELQSCEDCVIIKTGTPISTKEIKICSVCGGKKKESVFDAMKMLDERARRILDDSYFVDYSRPENIYKDSYYVDFN